MGSKTRNTLKGIVAVLLTPVLLFLLLAVLIYLPPVQNWLVDKVASYASEKTGMQISIDHVNLEFPLDLGIDGFRMIQQQDTIADVEHMTVDVELLPLLRKRVVIDELEITNTKLNTSDLIATARIKGQLERLFLTSRGIDLERETIDLNGATLDGAIVDIALVDTVIPDTSTSKVAWKIYADSLTINQSQVAFHMPGDTLSVNARLGRASAYDGVVDLDKELYSVNRFVVRDGTVAYDQNYEPAIDGFDYNHIALENVQIDIDSISYQQPRLYLNVRQIAMRDKSGLEITELKGLFSMDAAGISLPHAKLRTPDSDLEAELNWIYGSDETNSADEAFKVRLNAQLGKQDLMRFMGSMPQGFQQQWPNHPLTVRGSVNGNMQQVGFTGLLIDLPTAFHASADGTAANLNDMNQLKADVELHAKTENLDFLTSLVDIPDMLSIPRGITLDGKFKADGSRYDADFVAREGQGTVKGKGFVQTEGNMQYQADLQIRDLNIHHFMPRDSIYTVTADVSVDGAGFDFFSPGSRLDATADISNLHYGSWNISDVQADAVLKNGRAQANIISHNALADGTISVDALLSTKKLDATINTDLSKVDLHALRLYDDILEGAMCGHIDVTSDLKDSHHVQGYISDMTIRDASHTYRPTDITIDAKTNRDTTWAQILSGDITMNMSASGGYESLIDQLMKLSDETSSQLKERIIDQPKLISMLPVMHVDIKSGNQNPLMAFFQKNSLSYKDLFLDLTTSPEKGINGSGYVYSLVADSNRIDTIDFRIITRDEGRRIKEKHISFNAHIQNNKRNPQFVFNAMIDGAFHQSGAVAGVRFYDANNKLGIRLGANAELLETGINLRLVPSRPTIGYKEFNLNADNYIFLGPNNRIKAKVDLIADDGTGLKVYSEDDESPYMQDLTVSVNKLNLGELTSVFPYYLPQMGGLLNGDFHVVQDEEGRFSVLSDMAVQNLAYEESQLGNISTELVYLEKGDDAHAVEARIMKDDEEIGLLSGTYYSEGEGGLDASFTMTRFPLKMLNGFIPDQVIGLEGYAEGQLAIKGTTSHPQVNGEVLLDSSALVSEPYGIRLRFDDDPVRIVGSHLLLENFTMYAYNDNPLNIQGDVDFSDLENMSLNVRMRARDFQLINSRKTPRSETYGKAFVNFFGRMSGPLNNLSMRGRLDVLGSTDMAYILRDSPISTDNQLNELVTFVDFNDTAQVVINRPQLSGFNMDMTIDVSQGAHIIAYLNTDQSNYVDLMGGGTLRMMYNPVENLRLTGKYTLNNGEMKYSLPVIPLKTFTIQNGSYIEFTGDVMNPTLNITATEKVKATVLNDAGTGRTVNFDCGVVITKTLSDMGLVFTLDAPEDMQIRGELLTMSTEQRAKLAVTMLTTGVYLTSGSTAGFTMNSALSSFLSSEINNLTGNALRSLDLSIGMDNVTDASGAMHTDYSFKFAKRFMDNRLRVMVGGKVSTDNDMPNQNTSFLDNVTLEYRLDQTANKYVTLFYQNNSYDWLDGYTQRYGAGFIWRRKLSSLADIFNFKADTPALLTRPLAAPTDSTSQKK